MKLQVTSERGVYVLACAIVVTATTIATSLAWFAIHLFVPVNFPETRAFLENFAYITAIITTICVGGPFGIFVGYGLLRAHQLTQAMHQMATTDHLTGLPNRTSVIEQITQAVRRARDTRCPGAVLFVDLDHFKKINDTYGHAGGDAALRHAASLMRDALGPDMILGRFGGEEFVCFVPDGERAEEIAAAVVMDLRMSNVSFNGRQINVTASIGLVSTAGANSIRDLLSKADAALYIAKASGRDRIVNHADIASLGIFQHPATAEEKTRSARAA
jgi:diguanylate cyclase (GGDEF)-like protein